MKQTVIIAAALTLFLLGTGNLEAQRRDANASQEKTTSRRSATQGTSKSSQNNSQKATDTQRKNEPQGNRQNPNNRGNNDQQTIIVKRNKEPRQYPSNNAVIVHDRRGEIGRDMPGDRTEIEFGGRHYQYSQGRYYRKYDNDYRLVPPPHGIRVSIIPRGFLTIMVQGIPYYYFEGVYYRHYEADRNYEVVTPPMGAIVPDLPNYGVRTLYIDNKTVLEYDNILYKPIVTRYGVQYKVIGMLSAELYEDSY